MLPHIMDLCASSAGKKTFITNKEYMTLLSVAALSKGYTTASCLLGLRGSNPTGGVDVCLLWVLCVVR
jgi:hypothetical protein